MTTAKYRAAHLEEERAYKLAYRSTHQEEARAYKLKLKYGITLEDYDRILVAQGGRCKVCGTDKPGRDKDFFVDHDHKTGQVRGLLCLQCNAGLGAFREDRTILASADLYLRGIT